MIVHFARPARCLWAAAVVVGLGAQAALAQTWSEPRYNPEVGSRWRIESQIDTTQGNDVHGRVSQHQQTVAELTIDAKLADGFRISYVARKIAVTGNQPIVAVLNATSGAMQGIVVHARTDAAGRPVAVENIAAVRAAFGRAIDRMAAAMARKPGASVLLKQYMARVLTLAGPAAATLYLGDLPQLADAQNTGLKPGEVRREPVNVPSPIGGLPIQSTVISRLAAWDDAAGTARIVRKRIVEPAAFKAFTLGMIRRIGAASHKPLSPQAVATIERIDIQMNSETTIDVKGGMARRLETHSAVTASGFGKTFHRQETKVVTVTALAN